jgi:hypothetical protein
VTAGQSFTIDESAANGSVVGSVTASDEDALTGFSITGGSGQSIFAIDSTGQITVANHALLDSAASFTLTVTATDGTFTSAAQTVTITVTDNDLAITTGQSFTIDESAVNGSVVGTVAASDEEALTGFAITGGTGQGIFAIDSTGQITVFDQTHLESATSFTLTVTATDGTFTSAAQTVTIHVTDNDLLISGGPFTLDESSANGSVVGTLTASDADDAGASFSGWAIVSGNSGGAFAIDPSSGQITVADQTRLDSASTFTLGVTVTDGTFTSPVQLVTIHVTDNDLAVTAGQSFTIDESAANGSVVGSVTASDEDALTGFSITGGTGLGIFAIDSTGQITVVNHGLLDSAASFTLTVTATDGTFTSAAQTVTITITDNDLAITTGQSFSVPDVATNGTVVGTVTADDEEALTGFSITGGSGLGIFAIDSIGRITVLDQTQLSSAASFTLNVTATDGLFTSAPQTVVITIIDHDLSISGGPFTIDESSANGSVVGTLTASDADDVGASFSGWAIVSGNSSGAFAIDATTGQITVANHALLDSATTFTLGVTVSDQVGVSPVQAVTITITDNDLAVTSGQSFTIDESAANGSVVGTVTASDEDALTGFNITGGTGQGIFSISSSGQLTVANHTLLDGATSFTLLVTVTDGTFTSAAQTVTIHVTDNDLAVTAGQSFTIDESAANGSIVGTVTAGDEDALTGFAITGGTGLGIFAIGSSGQITVANHGLLDSAASFTLLVTATDGTFTSAAQTVTIHITDNDLVVTAGQSFTIDESAANGSVVGTVTASDEDALTGFAITGGTGQGIFAIDSTGQITVANHGLLDSAASFTLTVTVTDGTFTSAAQTVTIHVTDNDLAVTAGQSFSVHDTATNGTVVGTVTAGDEDALTGFSITGGTGQAIFAIDSTGKITVLDHTQLSSASSFTLLVTATDGTFTSAAQTVTINVLTNHAPTIAGTVANQATNDNQPITPFSGVTIDDVDSPAQTLTVKVTLGSLANGTFTAASLAASGFTASGTAGQLTFHGTAVQATTAIQQLVFQPILHQVASGSVTTTFTIDASDGLAAAPSDSTTSVVATATGSIVTRPAGTVVVLSAVSPVSDAAVETTATLARNTSVGVVARSSASGTTFYLGSVSEDGKGHFTASISRSVNGKLSTLVRKTISLSSGTVDLRLEVFGSSLKLFVGGQLQLFTNDTAKTALTGAGQVGVRSTTTVKKGIAPTFSGFQTAPITATPVILTSPFTDGFGTGTGNDTQLGLAWQQQLGDFVLAGGQARSVARSSLATLNGLSTAAVTLEADVTLNVKNGRAGFVVDYTSGPKGPSYYSATLVEVGKGRGKLVLTRVVNGHAKALKGGSVALPAGFDGSIPQHLVLTVSGGSLQLRLGATQVSVTDLTPLAGGTAGLLSSQGESFANFKAS